MARADWIWWEIDGRPRASSTEDLHPCRGTDAFASPIWASELGGAAAVAVGSYDWTTELVERLEPHDGRRRLELGPSRLHHALSAELYFAGSDRFEMWLEAANDEAFDLALTLIRDAGGWREAHPILGPIMRAAEALFPSPPTNAGQVRCRAVGPS